MVINSQTRLHLSVADKHFLKVKVHQSDHVCMTAMLIDITCLLVSIEIISGCRILKQWGLHQVYDTATLGKVYYGVTLVCGLDLNCKTMLSGVRLGAAAARVGLSRFVW